MAGRGERRRRATGRCCDGEGAMEKSGDRGLIGVNSGGEFVDVGVRGQPSYIYNKISGVARSARQTRESS